MLPAFMALRPAIKYGILIGVPLAMFGGGYVTGCTTGERNVHREWDASIAQQARESVKEVVKAQVMESEVVREIDTRHRDIRQRTDVIRKKKVAHEKTIVLSPATVQLHNELRGLSEQAHDRMPAADPGTGTSEVPPGGVGSPAVEFIPIEADGEELLLTTEELKQAAVDYFEKYALLRNSYRGLSEWNDGRETLEKARFGIEEQP